jgi:hypothetical protein
MAFKQMDIEMLDAAQRSHHLANLDRDIQALARKLSLLADHNAPPPPPSASSFAAERIPPSFTTGDDNDNGGGGKEGTGEEEDFDFDALVEGVGGGEKSTSSTKVQQNEDEIDLT